MNPLAVSLKVLPSPDPECPRCHHPDVERLDPVVPHWLACPQCGHMWSARAEYATVDRDRAGTNMS